MYPRNAASPERIAIGQVVLIADGTVQSASVTITVRGQGGAEASGGGTTAFGADNTVYYTPTQAETNFTSFVVIASKASCFSASQTIITSASSTAGNVILAGVTHTSAVIPTVTTLTGHTAQTGDSFARIGANGAGLTNIGTIATVTNLTNAPTNGDLTATMKTSVTTAASSSTPSVTVSDKTGFSLSTAGILAIWHQLTSAIVTAGTAGKLLVDNLNATVSSRATSAKQDTMETTLNAAATASALATVDTVVDAVKVQTDKMVFTKANELDVNTKSINDAEVIGDGNATPWDGV